MSVRRAPAGWTSDRAWLTGFMTERWGAPLAAGGGRLHRLDDLPGFAAVAADGAVAGVVTYLIEADVCEVVSIDARRPGRGRRHGAAGGRMRGGRRSRLPARAN